MREFYFICLMKLGLCLPVALQAQQLNPQAGEVFRDDVVPRIDIFLPSDSLNWLLDPANIQSDHHILSTFMFDNGTVKDTVEDVGFRLKGNTSRSAGKKSFKISFNTYSPGRKYYGLEKINLNGQHNDPTAARAKIASDLARDMGLPAMRANHARLYINSAYFGLYTHVEHIDEVFVQSRFRNQSGNLYKCLWPADLSYKGDNPNLYKAFNGGRPVYELKTNLDQNDYSDLAHFIDVLNNTPLQDLACELEKVFNVDNYLKAIVFDILIANWDGPIYNKNNFYLYHNQESGQFEYIPFDLDNILGISWSSTDWAQRDIYDWSHPSEPRPLYDRILSVPDYRERFTYYMQQSLEQWFNEERMVPYIDQIRERIRNWIAQDTYYRRSYGFSMVDFEAGFENATPYFHTDDYGIKDFILTRAALATIQLDTEDKKPLVYEVKSNMPRQGESFVLTAKVADDGGVANVEFCMDQNGSNDFQCIAMKDDGNHFDGLSGDGVYGVEIPQISQGTFRYYLKAKDNQAKEALFPLCEPININIPSSKVKLAINEFLASNQTVLADEEGEFDDWVEIFNYDNVPLYLGDKYLSDDQLEPNKWALPDIMLEAGAYLLIWTDDDDGQGDRHTNFKLRASGEFIGIFDNESMDYNLIDGIEFSSQVSDVSFGRIPDGIGIWQELEPSPEASNLITSTTNPFIHAARVYPNPFQDQVFVELPANLKHPIEFELIDPMGKHRFIKKLEPLEDLLEIDLENYPIGFYVLIGREYGKPILIEKLWKR